MAVITESQGRQELAEPQQEAWVGQIKLAAGRWGKYRHSLLFAATAVVVMAIAATFAATKVNGVIAGVAERQVTGLAEENTTRDALHIQSMVRGGGRRGLLYVRQKSCAGFLRFLWCSGDPSIPDPG